MNKRKGIIALIMLLVFTYAQGQDKIITTQKDTISCRIVSISLKFIKYEQDGYGQETMSQTIPTGQVKEYSLGPGPRSQTSYPTVSESTRYARPYQAAQEKARYARPSEKPITHPKRQQDDPFQRWRVGIQGGGSYLLNSLAPSRQAMKDLGVNPEQANDYYKQLRMGIAAGADVYYMVARSWGVGLKYSFFTSSIQKSYTAVGGADSDIETFTTITHNVNEKERLFLHYLGPSVFLRQWLTENRKFSLSEELSVGYILYSDKAQYDPSQYLFTSSETNEPLKNVLKKGNTYSGIFQLSLEYHLSPAVSIGLNAGVVPVFFRRLNISENGNPSYGEKLGKTNQLDLSRVDGSLGIHFYF